MRVRIELSIKQLEAAFEGGVLRPLVPLALAERQRVTITIDTRESLPGPGSGETMRRWSIPLQTNRSIRICRATPDGLTGLLPDQESIEPLHHFAQVIGRVDCTGEGWPMSRSRDTQ